MWTCRACGKVLEQERKIGRQEICPFCRNDLHSCLNCSLYDEYAQNHCREPVAERVIDPEKNNFCAFFTFREGVAPGGLSRKQEEARAKLEALFKKKTS